MLTAHAIDPSLAGVITAIVGAVVGIGGLALNRSSQREQARQQAAADRAAQDSRKASHLELALDAMQRRAEMAEAGEIRKTRRVDELEDELDEQRDLHRHQLAAQEARCREQLAAVTDVALTLRAVVNSEIAEAAARTTLDRVLPHPHEPRPARELPGSDPDPGR